MNNNEKAMNDKEVVMKAFQNDEVRDDHYDGQCGIYRLAADISMDVDNDFQGFYDKISQISIRPSRILIYNNYRVGIDWSPKGFQMVTSKHQYLNLVLDFVDYLHSISIDGLSVDTGMFCDDPDWLSNNPIRNINAKPSFNKECFDYSEIQVIDFRR